MMLGTIKVVWLETQGSVWEMTQDQGEGQESLPFGLFKYLLHSPFLSYRDECQLIFWSQSLFRVRGSRKG